MARCNVTQAKGLGWCLVIERGVSKGWGYRYNLKLECGHEQLFVTEASSQRSQEASASAPAWVECKECN